VLLIPQGGGALFAAGAGALLSLRPAVGAQESRACVPASSFSADMFETCAYSIIGSAPCQSR
jgi:hypothetical protein